MTDYGSIKLNTVKYQDDDICAKSEANLLRLRRIKQANSQSSDMPLVSKGVKGE